MIKILIPQAEGIYGIAADTLSSLWKQVTGETLETVFEDDGSDLLVIGSDAVNAFTHGKIIQRVVRQFIMPVGSDAYCIRSAQDADGRKLLFFAGARPRAILYAIYRFFELRANCRYFWDGDIIPHADSLDITDMDIQESPRFTYRGLRYFAHRSLNRFQAEHWDFPEWQHEIDWLLKKRLNLFMLRIGLDDVFQKAFPDIVHYPENYAVPEAKPRSYDDRNLFWSLQYRGELRKKILAYARERDLLHPEDLGTMTHWYSRTPLEYLDAVNPDFIPQVTGGYSENTGLVWDIRQDKNLDAYFKLTETHIREYGAPTLFHTIGLAERRCYDDRALNHQMKLYTYRRIQSKLREKYPNAPLLIASWDFGMYWNAEDVRDLVKELNPDNTVILDYLSDSDDELRNFQNWDIVGRFPWIFGIFHAYESNNEPRGNYAAIARRLPIAIRDPQCKGLIAWPENSHADTLMLEYLAANAWQPDEHTIPIASFLETFIDKRYDDKDKTAMAAVWRAALPVIEAIHWNAPGLFQNGEGFKRLHYEFFARPSDCLIALSPEKHHTAEYYTAILADMPQKAVPLLRRIADIDFDNAHPFVFRDALDIVRAIFSRITLLRFNAIHLMLDDWCNGKGNPDEITRRMAELRTIETIFRDILAASDEYSLWASLKALEAKHATSPNFENTLKGNAENGYCRSFVTELFDGIYLPQFDICADFWKQKFLANDRAFNPRDLDTALMAQRDDFYAKPLAELKPDTHKFRKDINENLWKLADSI